MRLKADIIYEDDHILVVNKQAGLLVLPDRYDEFKANLTGLLKRHFDPLFVVHRIDKDTSGIILYAKSEAAHKQLCIDFENRAVIKTYVCLVDGQWHQDQTVDIGIEKHSAKKRMRTSQKGKVAVSHFKLLEKFDKWSYLQIGIETGRTHQIRVHARHLGYPIVADPIYNEGVPLTIEQIKKNIRRSREESRPLLGRTALHAETLSFSHPISKENISLSAPLPKDFKAAINQLRKWAKIR